MSDRQPLPLNEAADRIVDVWLEEVYGGLEPPDLTRRILAADSGRQRTIQDDKHRHQREDTLETDDQLPAVTVVSQSVRRRPRRIAPAISAAAALLLLAGTAFLAWQDDDLPSQRTRPSAKAPAGDSTKSPGNAELAAEIRHRSATEPQTAGDTIVDPVPWEKRSDSPLAQTTPHHATPPTPTPLPADDVSQTIDRLLTQSWQVAHLEPSPPAEASIWCRRVYLRILGRIPTVEELEHFLRQPAEKRRSDLVDHLLTSPNHADERADYWSTRWTNAFIGRTGGSKQRETGREQLTRYLATAIRENRPYDQIVYELMSANDTEAPLDTADHGAAGFWLVHYSADAVRVTDWATRVFWGQPLGCVRCHDQFDGPATQEEFWSLNAVLRTASLVRSKPPKIAARSGNALPEVFYERPDGRLAMAVPRLPDGSEPGDSLSRDPSRLRKVVARQFADSPHVARALVNRLWDHFLGFGFTRPIDDMAPPREVSHPELLDFLAGQLRAHDYDWRELVRWIVLSEPFGRSSRITPENEDDIPETGTPPFFTRYYARPLAPEAVYHSLTLVANPARKHDEMVAARKQWLGHWTESMETDDGSEHSLFKQGVQKSWRLMNDPLMQRATSSRERGFLRSVADSKLPAEQKISHLFLAALARRPTAKERKLALSLLEQHQADPAKALEDVWWALLNSNEFLSDH